MTQLGVSPQFEGTCHNKSAADAGPLLSLRTAEAHLQPRLDPKPPRQPSCRSPTETFDALAPVVRPTGQAPVGLRPPPAAPLDARGQERSNLRRSPAAHLDATGHVTPHLDPRRLDSDRLDSDPVSPPCRTPSKASDSHVGRISGQDPAGLTEALRKAAFLQLLREGIEANPGMADSPRESSPGHPVEDPFDDTIFPQASSDDHYDEHRMFYDMRRRLREAKHARERVRRFLLRYVVPIHIAIIVLALLVAAFARLLQQCVEANPGPSCDALEPAAFMLILLLALTAIRASALPRIMTSFTLSASAVLSTLGTLLAYPLSAIVRWAPPTKNKNLWRLLTHMPAHSGAATQIRVPLARILLHVVREAALAAATIATLGAPGAVIVVLSDAHSRLTNHRTAVSAIIMAAVCIIDPFVATAVIAIVVYVSIVSRVMRALLPRAERLSLVLLCAVFLRSPNTAKSTRRPQPTFKPKRAGAAPRRWSRRNRRRRKGPPTSSDEGEGPWIDQDQMRRKKPSWRPRSRIARRAAAAILAAKLARRPCGVHEVTTQVPPAVVLPTLVVHINGGAHLLPVKPLHTCEALYRDVCELLQLPEHAHNCFYLSTPSFAVPRSTTTILDAGLSHGCSVHFIARGTGGGHKSLKTLTAIEVRNTSKNWAVGQRMTMRYDYGAHRDVVAIGTVVKVNEKSVDVAFMDDEQRNFTKHPVESLPSRDTKTHVKSLSAIAALPDTVSDAAVRARGFKEKLPDDVLDEILGPLGVESTIKVLWRLLPPNDEMIENGVPHPHPECTFRETLAVVTERHSRKSGTPQRLRIRMETGGLYGTQMEIMLPPSDCLGIEIFNVDVIDGRALPRNPQTPEERVAQRPESVVDNDFEYFNLADPKDDKPMLIRAFREILREYVGFSPDSTSDQIDTIQQCLGRFLNRAKTLLRKATPQGPSPDTEPAKPPTNVNATKTPHPLPTTVAPPTISHADWSLMTPNESRAFMRDRLFPRVLIACPALAAKVMDRLLNAGHGHAPRLLGVSIRVGRTHIRLCRAAEPAR